MPLLVFAALAITVAHHEMLFTGLRLILGRYGDSTAGNFMLEFNHRWLMQQPGYQSFWDQPILYPQPNTTAYTALLLGATPLYSIWRWMGLEPDTAMQFWMFTVTAANFAAYYIFLRLALKRTIWASAVAALLFSSANVVRQQTVHQTLLQTIFLVAVVGGLFLLFSAPARSLSRLSVWVGLTLCSVGLAAQLYTDFYFTWFLVFGLTTLAPVVLLAPEFRRALLDFLRVWWLPVAVLAIVGSGLVLPAVLRYYGIIKEFGPRPYAEVRLYLPDLSAWMTEGSGNLFYGWLNDRFHWDDHVGGSEMRNGLGFVTWALVILGFIRFRRHRGVLLVGLGCLFMMILMTAWPGGFSFWQWVYRYYPGAGAPRCVGRAGAFLVLGFGVGLAFALDWLTRRRGPLVAALAGLLVIGEQFGTVASYEKLAWRYHATESAKYTLPECRSFFLSWQRDGATPELIHTIAMWVNLYNRIPTLNSYTGLVPKGWTLLDPQVGGRYDRARVAADLRRWMELNPGKFTEKMCWIVPVANEREALQIKMRSYAVDASDLEGPAWQLRRLWLELTGLMPEPGDIAGHSLPSLTAKLLNTPAFRDREQFVVQAWRKELGHDPTFSEWLPVVNDLFQGRLTQDALIEKVRQQRGSVTVAPIADDPEHARSLAAWFSLLRRNPEPGDLKPTAQETVAAVLESPDYVRAGEELVHH